MGVEIIQKKRSVCGGQGASHLLACVYVCVHARVGCAHVWGPTRSAVQALAAGHGAARPGGRQTESSAAQCHSPAMLPLGP